MISNLRKFKQSSVEIRIAGNYTLAQLFPFRRWLTSWKITRRLKKEQRRSRKKYYSKIYRIDDAWFEKGCSWSQGLQLNRQIMSFFLLIPWHGTHKKQSRVCKIKRIAGATAAAETRGGGGGGVYTVLNTRESQSWRSESEGPWCRWQVSVGSRNARKDAASAGWFGTRQKRCIGQVESRAPGASSCARICTAPRIYAYGPRSPFTSCTNLSLF